MTKRNKTVLIALPLLILAGIAIVLFFFDQEGFTGSRVKTRTSMSWTLRR